MGKLERSELGAYQTKTLHVSRKKWGGRGVQIDTEDLNSYMDTKKKHIVYFLPRKCTHLQEAVVKKKDIPTEIRSFFIAKLSPILASAELDGVNLIFILHSRSATHLATHPEK